VSGQGRCAGCGMTGPAKKVSSHITGCPDYAALFQAEPVRALEPRAEYARWEREDKACGRKDRISAAVQATLERRAVQAGRFARLPDILED